MTINVELVGFSNISVRPFDLLRDLPSTISPYLQEPEENLGMTLSMNYTLTYHDNETVDQSMRKFIQSAIVVKSPPVYLQQFFRGTDSAQYGIIQTRDLENWLLARRDEFGISDSHYTLLLANFTGVSNYDHYYEATYDGHDANFQQARYADSGFFFPVVDWLISWGGNERFYFIDLSAGSKDASHDYSLSAPSHVPIQYFFPKYRSATNESITSYVADYASQAIRQLMIKNYSRFPPLSQNHLIRIFLLDDTGRIFGSNYESFINASLVEHTLQGLYPNAVFTVDIQFIQLQTDPQLAYVLGHSVVSETKEVGFDQTGLVTDHYDAGQIYAYLKPRLETLVGSSANQGIPIFLFALKSASRLVGLFKETEIQTGLLSPDGVPRDAALFVYPEVALISLSERQLFYWGVGFSRPVCQVAASMVGLESSPDFSFVGGIPSVMSSLTYAYGFTYFEKDSINRANADYVLSLDKLQLDSIQATNAMSIQNFQDPKALSILNNASTAVDSGQQAYDNLDFLTAIQEFEQGYSLIEQVFDAHAQWLRQAIDAMPPNVTFAEANLVKQARGELDNALTARNSGALVDSFQHLAKASYEAALAVNAEQSYGSTRWTQLALVIVSFAAGWILSVIVRRLHERTETSHNEP